MIRNDCGRSKITGLVIRENYQSKRNIIIRKVFYLAIWNSLFGSSTGKIRVVESLPPFWPPPAMFSLDLDLMRCRSLVMETLRWPGVALLRLPVDITLMVV